MATGIFTFSPSGNQTPLYTVPNAPEPRMQPLFNSTSCKYCMIDMSFLNMKLGNAASQDIDDCTASRIEKRVIYTLIRRSLLMSGAVFVEVIGSWSPFHAVSFRVSLLVTSLAFALCLQ